MLTATPLPPRLTPNDLEHKTVSDVLRRVLDRATGERISLGEIVEAFGERAFGFLLILFSLPNCVPAPPGLASIVGTPVLIFGIQMLLGHHRPRLPGFILRRSIATSTFRKVVDVAEPRLRKLESWCRPRHTYLFGPRGDRLIGLFAVVCAVCVIIPLPGTNFPPSIALVVVSIAVMQEDGRLLGVGLGIGALGITYTVAIITTAFLLAENAFGAWFGS